MKIIRTHEVEPDDLTPWERENVYNGLDCCVTAEVLGVLLEQLDNQTASTYAFSRSLQGPVLEMRLRGVLVDKQRRAEVVEELFERLDGLERNLYAIVSEGLGFWEFNWRSNADLRAIFYEELGIPPYRRLGRVTVDSQALERLGAYMVARPIVEHLLAMRALAKKISVLKTDIDRDGRIRTSYNIAGTETGRFSSSFSEFGTGTNLQNVEDSLRSIFVADPGMKMAYFDAKSGESYCVGAIEWNLFNDESYLHACESGDPHTEVAKLVWPEFKWSANPASNRSIADQKFYRHRSYRDICKNIGHGTNYLATPKTLADTYRVPLPLVQAFQPKYFAAFPAHQRWHTHVYKTLYTTGQLTTLTGRKRQFWGRRDSDETLREAIAYDPQGSLADIVNRGMLAVWSACDCQLLLQNHDAIVVQYPEAKEDRIVESILAQLKVPIELRGGRVLTIPYGCETGWNFGKASDVNPDGLAPYTPGDKRKRTPPVHILDRPIRRIHK
jgi:DNA polymerase-1